MKQFFESLSPAEWVILGIAVIALSLGLGANLRIDNLRKP